MNHGLRLNGVNNGKFFTTTVDFSKGGVDYNEGIGSQEPHEREAQLWIKCLRDDRDPLVLPEQAYCVTRILEGIYESAKSGDIFRFLNIQ